MAGEVGSTGGGGSGGENGASSPNWVKFLCSYGGRILPRPSDGQLKYVGGETRVISLSRDIAFSELMKKLDAMSDGDMVLKYQLVTEDLDTLVSVKSDEDLKHMLDEYDRQESQGSARLRAFLFPSKPIMIESQTPLLLEHHMLEQRYIDALNGIIRSSPKMQPLQQQQIAPLMMAISPMGSFSLSSGCSSPKSSPEHHADMAGHRSPFTAPMPKVHSSPSISSLQQQAYQSHVHGRPPCPNSHHHHAYQSSFGAKAHNRGIRTPPPLSSPGRSELGNGRSSMMGTAGHAQNQYPPSSNSSPRSSLHRQSGGGGGNCNKCGYYDECPLYACNRNMDKAAESLPRSPR